MGDNSTIEWTDATWNPVTGCSICSPGCAGCYAMTLAGTRLRNHPSRAGLTQPSKTGPVWTGEVRLNPEWLDQPIHWRRPRHIFVCAHADLFHEAVPDEWIDRIFAIMALSPQHIFQVLTKRSSRMRAYLNSGTYRPILDEGSLANPDVDPIGKPGARVRVARCLQNRLPVAEWGRGNVPWPLSNVWLGVSAERQQEADERIPHLVATPAARRFISYEPALGPINLAPWFAYIGDPVTGNVSEADLVEPPYSVIDWVIAGGESGPHARPSHPGWFRALRDQCHAAGVPFFFKQWGEWLPAGDWYENHPVSLPCRVWHGGKWTDDGGIDGEWMVRLGKAKAGALLDGRELREMPR